MLALDAHPYAMEFRNATTKEWRLPLTKSSASLSSTDSNKKASEFRAVYGDSKSGIGEYVLVSVHEAGLVPFRIQFVLSLIAPLDRHMVPYDQPEAALDLIERWLKNKPFDARRNGSFV
jgi:cathepsin A (carboxypeptidase C)